MPLVQELSGVRHWKPEDVKSATSSSSIKVVPEKPLITELSSKAIEDNSKEKKKIVPKYTLRKTGDEQKKSLEAEVSLPKMVSLGLFAVFVKCLQISNILVCIFLQKRCLFTFINYYRFLISHLWSANIHCVIIKFRSIIRLPWMDCNVSITTRNSQVQKIHTYVTLNISCECLFPFLQFISIFFFFLFFSILRKIEKIALKQPVPLNKLRL